MVGNQNVNKLFQDHLTLLNGESHISLSCRLLNAVIAAYNAFTRYGRSSSWCKGHALSFRAMSRAVSIRAQLRKYMNRFNLPLESCEGDAKRLRQCLVSGYWRNGARWIADGTYRSVRGDKVCVYYLKKNQGYQEQLIAGLARSSQFRDVYQKGKDGLGRVPRN